MLVLGCVFGRFYKMRQGMEGAIGSFGWGSARSPAGCAMVGLPHEPTWAVAALSWPLQVCPFWVHSVLQQGRSLVLPHV